MRRQIPVLLAAITLAAALPCAAAEAPKSSTDAKSAAKKEVSPVWNFKMKSLDGKDVDLSRYQGKVALIVNVASHCGNTKQYTDLQALHKKYAADGLAILGFPANDFGKQEPGTSEEIATFCKKNYGVEFDMFSKVTVLGDEKCDLYKYLTSKETDPKFPGEIQWNFEKFLIGRNGQIVARFAPGLSPSTEQVVKAIEAELANRPA